MPTLAELRTERGQVADQIKAITTKAKAEGRRLLAEEQEQIRGLLAKDAEIAQAIAAEEQADIDSAALLAQAETTVAAVGASRGRRTTSASGAPRTLREGHEDDPNHGFASEREYFSAVMQATISGRVDNRLRPLAAVGSDEQQTQNLQYGGYLVPAGFVAEPLMVPAESDPLAGFVRRIPMDKPIVKIPARTDKNHTSSVSGGFTVTRKAETVEATGVRAQFEQISLEAHNQFGVMFASEELLTDSPVSFVALAQASWRDEFASATLKERLYGTGVGEFLGIYNAPCLVTVNKESGQTATTLVYDNVLKMRARTWNYSRAIWLANHDTIPQLAKLTVASSNFPVYLPSAREDVPDMLLGRPIFYSEYAATLGTVGDIACIVGSEYLEGEYQPLQSADSMHVRFLAHERAFKFYRRNAGQPWWKSALTPVKGANTLSPFVVLQTRS